MSILNNFHWKIRKLLCLLAFFSISIPFLAAQGCPSPTGLSKDSATVVTTQFSWNAVLGARGYKVTYTTPSDTFLRRVATNSVSFSTPINTDFEILTVTTICSNGDESEPSALIDGGIVITVDDIFRLQNDCDNPGPNSPEFLFFSDLCRYTHFNDLCLAIEVVNGPSGEPDPNQDPVEWLDKLIDELSSGGYLWEHWDSQDGCQEPLRLQRPVVSQLEVGPNPFNHSFTARFYAKNAGLVSLSLIDMMGRTVERHQFTTAFSGEQRFDGLGKTLSPGMYFLQIQSNGQQLTVNVLKQE